MFDHRRDAKDKAAVLGPGSIPRRTERSGGAARRDLLRTLGPFKYMLSDLQQNDGGERQKRV